MDRLVLDTPRRRDLNVDLVSLDCLGDSSVGDASVTYTGVQSRDDNVMTVYLKEAS